ncbi:protein kinase domain-containing protein, partial [Singulisphaera rosea]
ARGPSPRLPRSLAEFEGFRLTELLGRGGFGEVWKAEAPGGVQVALKFVRLDATQGTIEFRAFETTKGIRHPNLMSPFAAWQVDGNLVIGMELAEGTLMDRLNQANAQGLVGIPADELVGYLEEAAKGIDFLNERRHLFDGKSMSVQHRDVKPQNILLVGGGVKIADFGLARLLETSATAHSGALTPVYSAPEFFRGETSSRSDQYSLAVAYCQLRGGRPPFRGTAEALMHGHLMEPPDLSMLPPRERAIVRRALAKDPAKRWPDCRTFIQAVREAVKPKSPWRLRATLAATVLGLAALTFVLTHIQLPDAARTRTKPLPVPEPIPSRSGEAPSTPSVVPKPIVTVLEEPERVSPSVITKVQSPPIEPSPPVVKETATVPPPTRPKSFIEVGNDAFKAGDYVSALVAYSEVLAVDPDNVPALNNRGGTYSNMGLHDAAIEDFDRAIKLRPQDAQALFNRGTARIAMFDHAGAVQDLTAAIALDPKLAGAYTNRGVAYQKLGDKAHAEEDFAEASRLGVEK